MSEETAVATTEEISALPEDVRREIRTTALDHAINHLGTAYDETNIATVLRVAKSFAHYIETGEAAIYEDVSEEEEGEEPKLPLEETAEHGDAEEIGRLVPRHFGEEAA